VSSIASDAAKAIASITIPSGKWFIAGVVNFANNATGSRGISISTNQAKFSWASENNSSCPASTQQMSLNGISLIEVTKETTIYLNAYQTSGASLTINFAKLIAVKVA
jgi:hypothetical protein